MAAIQAFDSCQSRSHPAPLLAPPHLFYVSTSPAGTSSGGRRPGVFFGVAISVHLFQVLDRRVKVSSLQLRFHSLVFLGNRQSISTPPTSFAAGYLSARRLRSVLHPLSWDGQPGLVTRGEWNIASNERIRLLASNFTL